MHHSPGQNKVSSSLLNPGTGCFYGPDVLPINQSTVSKHWKYTDPKPVAWPNYFFTKHWTPEGTDVGPFILALQCKYQCNDTET